MNKFKRKRQIQKIVFSYGTIAILVLVAGFLSMSVYERYEVEREMSVRREQAEDELRALKQRAALLESQVDYLEHDRGIEAEIRGRFDVAKEGEQVVIILEDERSNIEPVRAPESEEVPEEPWYKFW